MYHLIAKDKVAEQHNLFEENSIRDARTPQPREIFLTP